MKTTKITLLVLTIFAVGALSSCKKKKEELPAAPESKVKSFTFTTTNSAWTQNGQDYNAIFTIEDIDSKVLSGGSVAVYRGDGTGSTWAAMPVTVDDTQYSYGIALHTVKIIVSGSGSSASSAPGIQQFRVVVNKE